MSDIKFYDTSALLLGLDNIFKEHFVISSITLNELEQIKSSAKKDSYQKYCARRVLNLIKDNYDICTVIIFNTEMMKEIREKSLKETPDMEILATAIWYDNNVNPDETIFATSDMALYHISNLFFGNSQIEFYQPPIEEVYTGYVEKEFSDEELIELYSDLTNNPWGILINQYLLVKNNKGEIVDKLCWTGETFRTVTFKKVSSVHLGAIKPYKNDEYQFLALDCLAHNKITMLTGPAGSGKSTLSLGYLFDQLEKHKIDKIIIFCNTVATKDSARLGYYPGTKDEKLLDSQIGNFLKSKLGGIDPVEKLIANETLVLLPFSDIRGYDTSGMNAGIYITEAQNLSIELMRLALQRIGDDSFCILDGDMDAQVDLEEFEGYNNGMKRVSQVFRNRDIYGEINLGKIHRSKIAEIAQLL